MKDCVHHWIIEEATSPISIGICRNCGTSREFYNEIGIAKSTGYVPDSLTTGKRGKKLIKEKGE